MHLTRIISRSLNSGITWHENFFLNSDILTLVQIRVCCHMFSSNSLFQRLKESVLGSQP